MTPKSFKNENKRIWKQVVNAIKEELNGCDSYTIRKEEFLDYSIFINDSRKEKFATSTLRNIFKVVFSASTLYELYSPKHPYRRSIHTYITGKGEICVFMNAYIYDGE